MTEPPTTARARRAAPDFAAKLTFRFATDEDVAALVPMINEAYMREAWLLPSPRVTAEWLGDDLADSRHRVIIAEHDGVLAGSVRVQWDLDDGAWFGLLATSIAYQGRGVAPSLVAEAERIGREAGAGIMRLDCAEELGLPPYYESLGYEIESVEPEFYLSPGRGPITRVVLKKELA
ncbi:MAG TPA: GNAT family N-acetyltransferase [Dehalococcoidia bacterium]